MRDGRPPSDMIVFILRDNARSVLFLAACAAGLALCEGATRLLGLDIRLLGPVLYYQDADAPVHRPSADAQRLYELAPGASADLPGLTPGAPARRVTVNDLGMRGRPRSARKPPGVFRIICFGDSNTYGAAVDDDETYPAQLERRLNALGRGRYEVWNAGVSAYVMRQKVAAAREALARYEPDLILIQHINNGRRAFMWERPFLRYFDLDPGLWEEELYWVPWRGGAVGRALLAHSRFYRALVIAANYYPEWYQRERPHPASRRERPFDDDPNNRANAASLARFAEETRGRVPLALLLTPKAHRGQAIESLSLPTIDLMSRLPAGATEEYLDAHPPARVYRWYADVITADLQRLGLLARRPKPANASQRSGSERR